MLFLALITGAATILAAPSGAEPQPAPPPGPASEVGTVRVITHQLQPFVMSTGSGELTGFSIDLWNEIARRLDWDTEYLGTDDVRGQLVAVSEGRADIAVGGISLTAQREQQFDFTQPTLDAGLQIIVPVIDTRPSVPGLGGYLDLLLSKTMLIWLSAAIVVSVIPTHIFWFIERRSETPVVSRSYFPGIFEAFGWGIGSLVGRQSAPATRTFTKALAILWGFAGIVFVSFYTANLSATLTVTKLDAKITGPADLYDKSVATVAGTTAADYLRSMGVEATETATIDDSYELLRDEGYDAVVFDAPVLRYYVAHRGEGIAVMAGPVFQDENQGFVLSINSPLRKPINQTLFKMREDGTYNMIKEKWFGDDVATAGDVG
ncbi:transporter substrate-binding domain-containing protein [Mycolicibacterium neoaurum]|uniref:transporter substrate-binding domain-containing protein n=1 Tax=Mycolicibacterium neoaurum TaxID=1795 RepID=UPI0026738083|nr:transporter substrate-binding domain-containing protein [Mycolicibacterium neoaurum]MDO3401066.1 transporter substrate-binding domain-containing protein [Mycolicibacterium neoaurum]